MSLSSPSSTHVCCYLVRLALVWQLTGINSQGLNYIVIYPVMQFLIKKVIETREETGDLLRMYSESQFGKSYKMPNDIEFDRRKSVCTTLPLTLHHTHVSHIIHILYSPALCCVLLKQY
jgi:hypothetical protein